MASLNRLSALLSPHPYDLVPVTPAVEFDSLVTRFNCVAGMDVTDERDDLRQIG